MDSHLSSYELFSDIDSEYESEREFVTSTPRYQQRSFNDHSYEDVLRRRESNSRTDTRPEMFANISRRERVLRPSLLDLDIESLGSDIPQGPGSNVRFSLPHAEFSPERVQSRPSSRHDVFGELTSSGHRRNKNNIDSRFSHPRNPEYLRSKHSMDYDTCSDSSFQSDSDDEVRTRQSRHRSRYRIPGLETSPCMPSPKFKTRDRRESPVSRVQRKEKQPDTFDGKSSDWQDYIIHFEQVSSWNGWTESEKAQQLSMSLRGAAQKLLSNLSDRQFSDYKAVKQVLTQRFNPKERSIAYRCEFRNRKQGKNESSSDYGYQLRRLALLAYPETPYSALELQVVDQFVNGLNTFALRKKVTFSHPHTLEQAISSAVEYEALVGSGPRKPVDMQEAIGAIQNTRVKLEEDRTGSCDITLDQIAKLIDQKLKNFGKSLSLDPQKPVNHNACFYCKKEGHFRDSCPKLLEKLQRQVQDQSGN